jgi:4'-phosphopantetheinyl transferase
MAARRAILRTLLGAYVGLDPGALEVDRTDGGKPRCPAADPIAFNCSSSGPVAVFAFATEGRIGVDVEHRADGDWEEFPVSRFMSERERAALAALPAGEQTRRSARAWVVKEAVAKAIGTGFTLPPHELEVEDDADGTRIRLRGPWAEHASAPWATRVVVAEKSRVAAVALEGSWTSTASRELSR